jgi:uncharacterized protein YecE (DUF72 family)
MTEILVGTCSWTDPTLLATDFYPKQANTAEKRLQYYAEQFRLVEVDSTYYSMPAQKTARLWVERTPDNFTFNVKAFRIFTQHPTQLKALPKDLRAMLPPVEKPNIYYRDIPQDVRSLLWERFNEALLPLDSAGKLGVILLQFPEWFTPGRASQGHIVECRRNLAQFRVAVEFRNGAWLAENRQSETFGFLRDNGLGYVCVDEPQGFKSSVPPVSEATSDMSVVRFHGRNEETWEKKGIAVQERFKYLYRRDELGEWLPRMTELATKVKQLHVLFNNNYGNYAVRNARDFDSLLKSQPSLFPDYHKAQERHTLPSDATSPTDYSK